MPRPQYATQSQEDPQDIQVGERFMAKVVNAVMSSPNWPTTAFFINYDEGGGYYDHVPPPDGGDARRHAADPRPERPAGRL